MSWRWLPEYPTSDNRLYEIPQIISDNFKGIEAIYGVEHETLSSTGASGQHSPGRVSAVYEGTTAQIMALTNVPEGALAYDTTIGYWKKYISGSWLIMTNVHSRVRAFKTTSTSATTGATQSATGDWIIFDSEGYDELSEYDNVTGVFTANGSGNYIINATVSVCASAPIPTTTQVTTATGDYVEQWTRVPSDADHYTAIREYPTPNDTNYVTTNTSGERESYRQSKINQEPVPLGSTGLYVTVSFRARSIGCICNSTCYGESCSCYSICYGYSCSCYSRCYGYHTCTCNNTCYNYNYKSCTCYYTCYGYHACTCNSTCYGYSSCDCDAECYGEGGPCTCNVECYSEFNAYVAPTLTLSGSSDWVEYVGEFQLLESTEFQPYEQTWTVSPSTGLEWQRDEINKVGYFGLKFSNEGGATTGCSGRVSQEYMTFGWYPSLPVYILRLYKNDVEVEKIFQPIIDAGTESDQTIYLTTVVSLNPTDTIRVALVKVSDIGEQIIGSADGAYTNIAIHRIEGQCV